MTKKNDSILPLRLAAVLAVIAFAALMILSGKKNSSETTEATEEPVTTEEVAEAAEEEAIAPPESTAEDSKPVVALSKVNGRWQLQRNGKPFFVKGVGGDQHLAELAAAGGNSIRTWGIDDKTEEILDRAHSHGITVTLGHWLGHKRHGFDYNNPAQVKEQLDQVIAATKKFKDHPALLAWGVGNETEIGQQGNPNVWKAIESAAAAIKEIDPDHPTICVIAELGPDNSNIQNIAEHCPSIDIVGINTYDGALSVLDRYASANLDRPCILTEYGPKLPINLKVEPTSTDKAAIYKKIYENSIANHPLSLGGYSFLWGSKAEGSDTYFGQFLASGEQLAHAQIFHTLFGGEPPKNYAPECSPIQFKNETLSAKVGSPLEASWEVTDPESDTLTYRWELKKELAQTTGGDATHVHGNIDSAITNASTNQVTILHTKPGSYRLYAYAFDGQGNAATASARITIKHDVALKPSPKAELPFVLYEDNFFAPPFHPSGYQGPVAGSIKVDLKHEDNPHSGSSCVKITSSALANWVGVSLQSPANDWGQQPGGLDFTGAKKLTLYARGKDGGEKITFALGNLPADSTYYDTAIVPVETELTKEWKEISLDVTGKNLERIKTPLVWSATTGNDGLTFFIDSITIE